ncbi:MAG: DUF1311 domain-containing protein [Rhodobacteraceae bacterium]|nr:DUF1311 domain-containing protein [Paracoccaceae bacterium]
MTASAQPLTSIDEFDSELHLNLRGCFDKSLSENLACLRHAVNTCSGFTSHLGTAGGAYYCSYAAFEIVDAELNRVYPSYVDAASQSFLADSGGDGDTRGEDLLRAAQRAWIIYRDAMCVITPSWNMTNSGYDAVVDDCRSRLTLMQMETLSTELSAFRYEQ